MPSENNDILEITTQEDLQAYFDETYGEPAKLLASQGGAAKQIQQGDIFFQEKNYTQAAQHYLQSLRSPIYLFEGFYKIGLCILHGADAKKAKLDALNLYKKRGGDHLSPNDLAAVFFREVMTLEPTFNQSVYRLHKTPLNLYFSSAMYSLAVCLSQGAPMNAQDLINTPYEESCVSNINSENVQQFFYKSVLLINPEHMEARNKLMELEVQKLPIFWDLPIKTQDVSAHPSELRIAIKNVNPPILLSPHSLGNKQTVSSIDNVEDALVSPLTTPGSQKNARRLSAPPKLTSPPTELNLYELDQQGFLSPISQNISTPSSSSRRANGS